MFIFRENPSRYNTSTGSSRSSSRNYNSPLSVSPHLSPRGGHLSSQFSPAGSALTPNYSAPFEVMNEGYFTAYPDMSTLRRRDDNADLHVVNQVSCSFSLTTQSLAGSID